MPVNSLLRRSQRYNAGALSDRTAPGQRPKAGPKVNAPPTRRPAFERCSPFVGLAATERPNYLLHYVYGH